jgi:L-threonylcarbamoyladenylate synthase
MTGPVIVEGNAEDAKLLERIVRHLEGGGLLAYPTETVYGLGAAADAEGVAAVAALKARSVDRPFVLLLPAPSSSDPHAAGPIGGLRWTPAARTLARAFWPGPLTLVLSDEEGRFADGVRATGGGVAVRVSPHPFVHALLAHWRRPLVSTSANVQGQAPAADAAEVTDRLSNRPGSDRLWVVDGGRLAASLPSTVVDCTRLRPRVVRAGAVPVHSLRELVPETESIDD